MLPGTAGIIGAILLLTASGAFSAYQITAGDEFFDLLAANTRVYQLAHDLVHLYHPRSAMTETGGWRANDWVLRHPDGRPLSIGDPSRVPESTGSFVAHGDDR